MAQTRRRFPNDNPTLWNMFWKRARIQWRPTAEGTGPPVQVRRVKTLIPPQTQRAPKHENVIEACVDLATGWNAARPAQHP